MQCPTKKQSGILDVERLSQSTDSTYLVARSNSVYASRDPRTSCLSIQRVAEKRLAAGSARELAPGSSTRRRANVFRFALERARAPNPNPGDVPSASFPPLPRSGDPVCASAESGTGDEDYDPDATNLAG